MFLINIPGLTVLVFNKNTSSTHFFAQNLTSSIFALTFGNLGESNFMFP